MMSAVTFARSHHCVASYRNWMAGLLASDEIKALHEPWFQFIRQIRPLPGSTGTLVKVNPLANWSLQQVWEHIRMFDLPYNPLHDQGFVSIGCEPCTQAVGPGQHEREGRWWWEEATIKECGLHRGNLESNGND